MDPAPRIDSQVFELAAALKRENPGRTAAQVVRILRASTGWAPSESTLLRHFHRLEIRYNENAQPFKWKFTTDDLKRTAHPDRPSPHAHHRHRRGTGRMTPDEITVLTT